MIIKGPYSPQEWASMLDLKKTLTDIRGDNRFDDLNKYCRRMLKTGFGKEASASDPV